MEVSRLPAVFLVTFQIFERPIDLLVCWIFVEILNKILVPFFLRFYELKVPFGIQRPACPNRFF